MKTIETQVVSTKKQMADLLNRLVLLRLEDKSRHPYGRPILYIDIEGVDLCREGSISIFTLLIDNGSPTGSVYLIDVHSLGAQAFETAGDEKTTLKDILQNEKIEKIFFDVRNDSDALFAHFGVALKGVEDVQLLESATRTTTASRKFLSGLAKCTENNLTTPSKFKGLESWKQAKQKGEKMFMAKYGGSYEVSISVRCQKKLFPIVLAMFRIFLNYMRDLLQ